MNTNAYTQTVTGLITTFGSTAHKAIDAYRAGGARLQGAAEQQWQRAFKESASQLTPEARKNAAHAQQVFSGYYAKSLALSADGAAVVIDTLVGIALAGTERAAAFASSNLRKTA